MVSIVTAVLFGLPPAFHASRAQLDAVIKSADGRSSGSPGRRASRIDPLVALRYE